MTRLFLTYVALSGLMLVALKLAAPTLVTNSLRPSTPRPNPDISQRIIFPALDQELPPDIALIRFWEESRWTHMRDGAVIESNGNCGIAQLNAKYNPGACQMTETESIHEGVRQLADYWREFEDRRLVMIAYTAGPAVARADSE